MSGPPEIVEKAEVGKKPGVADRLYQRLNKVAAKEVTKRLRVESDRTVKESFTQEAASVEPETKRGGKMQHLKLDNELLMRARSCLKRKTSL